MSTARILVVMAAVVGLVGCGNATGDGTTVDRFTPGAQQPQSFHPDSPELAKHDSAAEQEASSTQSTEIIQGPVLDNDTGIGGGNISCSSRDGKKDCYCSNGCCRDETSCRCC
ncbi:hypothetical protein F0U60_01075 [Archangium minus]|uniref:Lipoprotein n=1 Tax=Archangium minus TaxID=83450 RepID=A0ABY9WGB0_9BACT|nr:hypothetical protein F0U60_01075 [Archangium minus]